MLRPLDRTLSSPAVPAGAKVLTIGELTRAVKGVLEQDFASFWATGEVSNLKRHSSGHIYMTLKDAESQIRAVMWRSQAIQPPAFEAPGPRVTKSTPGSPVSLP